MNERWNLDPIYTGFQSPAFQADLARLEECVQTLKNFPLTGDSHDTLVKGLRLQEELNDLVEKLLLYAELRQAADTLDAEAGSQMGRILGIYSETAAPIAVSATAAVVPAASCPTWRS